MKQAGMMAGMGLASRLIGRVTSRVFAELRLRTVGFTPPVREVFNPVRGRNLQTLSRRQIGELGEQIARDFLGRNQYTDIFAIQNASGNGIDIVARAANGRLAFFEVKTSARGIVGGLSRRQQNMSQFVQEILREASNGRGRYRGLNAATQDRAAQILREFNNAPENVRASISANVIGVDLLNEVIRVSPWW
jgi:filamentous hemagglutinin